MQNRRVLLAAGAMLVSPFVVAEVAGAERVASAGPADQVCNGSIPTAQSRKDAGQAIARSGLLGTFASIPVAIVGTSPDARNPSTRTRMEIGHYLRLAGFAAQLSGLFALNRSATSSAEWDESLQHLIVGQTTASVVEKCLGKPTSRTKSVINSAMPNNGPDETSWEYRTRTRNSWFGRSMSRVVTISFRDSVVSAVKITESR